MYRVLVEDERADAIGVPTCNGIQWDAHSTCGLTNARHDCQQV